MLNYMCISTTLLLTFDIYCSAQCANNAANKDQYMSDGLSWVKLLESKEDFLSANYNQPPSVAFKV